MEKERPKVGLGVIVRRGKKILIGQRTGNHGSGTWMIPGGHLEHGETFEAGAIRETIEETGLRDLRAIRVVSIDNHVDYGKHYISIGVLLESKTGEPTDPEPGKSEGWKWVDPRKKLPEPFFLPSRRAIENWLAKKIYRSDKGL